MNLQHKAGDKLYIPNALYISNGEKDVAGGLATIDSFEFSNHLPSDHYNYCMVVFKEVPGSAYNYNYLIENQEQWINEYAGKIAHPDPDINTPFIQKGDIVNGEVYKGDDIW